jgi:hypothetical protein
LKTEQQNVNNRQRPRKTARAQFTDQLTQIKASRASFGTAARQQVFEQSNLL